MPIILPLKRWRPASKQIRTEPLASSDSSDLSTLRHSGAQWRQLDDGQVFAAVAMALLLVIVIQVGMVLRGDASVLDGVLADPDAYLRLARIDRLAETGAWFDSVESRINPPGGFALHWTRPLDALILGGAYLGSPFLGFDKALFWSGAVVSPLLQLLSLIALVWASRPVLPRLCRCLLAFFYVAQPGILAMFIMGRSDHHGLLILCCILLLGLTIRLLLNPDDLGNAVWAGLVAAFAIWINVEALLFVVVTIAALGLFWLLVEARLARACLVYAAAILASLGAALLAERGVAGLGDYEIDRLSIAHIVLFAANFIYWAAMDLVQRRGRGSSALGPRAVWAGAGIAVTLGLLWWMHPAFFADPMALGDELYLTKHMANIEELQPLFAAPGEGGSWPKALARPVLWLGIALPAVPWLLHLMHRSPGPERRVWVFFALGLLLFTPFGVLHLRWVMYPELFLVIPYAALAGALVARLADALSENALSIVRPLVIAGLAIWFYVPTFATQAGPPVGASEQSAVSCPLRTLAPVLDDPAGLGAAPKRVLAFIDFGPELIYRTKHSVFAIPNHRRQPGFTLGYGIMTATDFGRARDDLLLAGIDLILICPGSVEGWFYSTEEPGRTLYQTLAADEPPAFLEPIALPGVLAEHFRLFSLRKSAE